METITDCLPRSLHSPCFVCSLLFWLIVEGRKEGRKEGRMEGWKEGWKEGWNVTLETVFRLP